MAKKDRRSLPHLLLILLCISVTPAFSQEAYDEDSWIKEMNWKGDYKIELTSRDDSIYVYDVKNLQHTSADNRTQFKDFTYYKARLSNEFISKLKHKGIALGIDTTQIDSSKNIKETPDDKTLWSALHSYIDGGWVHFVNTLLYSIESGNLNIRSPLMLRPDTKWKPKPVTDSYKRTRRWEYYVPINQRRAKREYKRKIKNNQLGDLQYIPDPFIELFMNTSNREYKKMIKSRDIDKVARIDMIKLLLGANYLGKPQIKYIKHMVLKSVMQYSKKQVPSVIIFDNYRAAVALTLEEKGYVIERIIFADGYDFSEDQLEIRRKAIRKIINNINEVNKEMFQERLKRYYGAS